MFRQCQLSEELGQAGTGQGKTSITRRTGSAKQQECGFWRGSLEGNRAEALTAFRGKSRRRQISGSAAGSADVVGIANSIGGYLI